MKTKLQIALLVSACCMLHSALADLTAIVTPGYQFPTDGSVKPSYPLLNRLASPTIQILGTVGGSNTLAAGSVTGTQLSSSVADGATIGFNANVPPGLRVLAGGIIGDGLQADSTTNMSVLVDTNYFQLATNSIASTNTAYARKRVTFKAGSLTDTNFQPSSVKPNKLTPDTTNNASGWLVFSNGTGTVVSFPPGYGLTRADGTNLTVAATNWFTLTNVSFSTSAGLITNAAHGYASTPGYVKWVAVCQTNDVGYEPGDEVNTSDFDGGTPPYFIGGANSTNVFITSSGGGCTVANKSTGSRGSNITATRWRLKCYARP